MNLIHQGQFPAALPPARRAPLHDAAIAHDRQHIAHIPAWLIRAAGWAVCLSAICFPLNGLIMVHTARTIRQASRSQRLTALRTISASYGREHEMAARASSTQITTSSLF